MAKKIKHFKLENFKPEELQKIEDDINTFTSTHNTIDVKIAPCYSFGWFMMYVVIYDEN